jgi:hypothetical protein
MQRPLFIIFDIKLPCSTCCESVPVQQRINLHVLQERRTENRGLLGYYAAGSYDFLRMF